MGLMITAKLRDMSTDNDELVILCSRKFCSSMLFYSFFDFPVLSLVLGIVRKDYMNWVL